MGMFMKKTGLADIKEETEGIVESIDGLEDAEASGGVWKRVLPAAAAIAAILIVCLVYARRAPEAAAGGTGEETRDGNFVGVNTEGPDTADGLNMAERPGTAEEPDMAEELGTADQPEPLNVSVDITEHYITHKGNPDNLYHIDENHVLWGCGKNEYGQLGQGTRDDDFHEDMVKIAENVVHVDYSYSGHFVIFLTKDHKLYGMGNAADGALQQYAASEWEQFVNADCYVSEPYLLAVNVTYACCGRDDIVCMKEDGSVWTWGTVYNGYFVASPRELFEKAVLVTGGPHNHAALLPNGAVWTWGYNDVGNCGAAEPGKVSEPTMAAEGVVMVWTDRVLDGYSHLDADDLSMAWVGKQTYAEHDCIVEYADSYPHYLANTVIQKADGSYWVCGENVGTEEKTAHGVEGDFTAVYTHEFQRCE